MNIPVGETLLRCTGHVFIGLISAFLYQQILYNLEHILYLEHIYIYI